jgi:hypothetical protein
MMISCHEVLRELSNYIDNDLDPKLLAAMEEHLRGCRRCSILLDTTQKTVYVIGDERIFEVPAGFSDRLHKLIDKQLGMATT